MKFSVITNKWANFYFFVQNLSEWHFSNRKDYNILWRGELGQFSLEEKIALSKFKKIQLRYPFGKSYLGRQFFLEENPWIVLDKKLLPEDFTNLKDIFSLLEKKFDAFYNKELVLLKKWQITLQKELSNKNLITAINMTLGKLYDVFPLSKDITIYLLPSSESHSGGTGGVIDDISINLEISRSPLKKVNHAVGIIWHEIIHLYFERQSFLARVSKKYPDDPDAVNLIKEVVASSLFPNGALGIKFLNIKSGLLNTKIPQKYTEKILILTNKYVETDRPFDDEYMETIYSLVSELKGNLK
ncbi:MAG: hypothetical protein AAB411_00735 [Patescibacteria group bacterium]